MNEKMQKAESHKKEKLSSSEQIRRLTSEEYFKGQKEIQILLLKNEKALGRASEILKNQRTLDGKIVSTVKQMTEESMDAFPKHQGGLRHPAAIEDPREIVKKRDEEWEEYNDHCREEVNQTMEQIGNFCKKWELDFNPYFQENISSRALWKELQKAYHAKMFEVHSGYEGEPDLHDI